MQNELEIKIMNSGTVYEDLSNNLLHRQINNMEEWQQLRNYKVTGSRLPALLGFYGSTKYDDTWSIVKNGKSERGRGLYKIGLVIPTWNFVWSRCKLSRYACHNRSLLHDKKYFCGT